MSAIQKSPTLFKEAVIAEAKAMKRKEELYEEIMKIEDELQTLSEHGFIGTFGFKSQGDVSSQTVTGFEKTPSISRVAQLVKDMEGDQPSDQSEVEKLKAEVESLRTQLAESSQKEEEKTEE